MVGVPLVEVQSSRTQSPGAGSSYPYVDLTLGDTCSHRVMQLQLEQVHTHTYTHHIHTTHTTHTIHTHTIHAIYTPPVLGVTR